MPESSFTEKYGSSFTNIPGGKGKQVWDIPELNWGQYATPQEREMQGMPQEPGSQVPMPEAPSGFKEYLAPDYSNRKLFEEHVMSELGKNPFELNPMEALTVADENLPELFQHFFGGRVVWNDRDKLTKEQAQAWDEVVKSYHAWAFEHAKMEKAVLTDRYNFMMNQFDNASKQYEANVKRIREEREKIVAEDKAKKAAAAAAKLKAAQPTPVKSADVGAYQKQFDTLVAQFEESNDVSTPSLEVFNKFATERNLPELEVVKTKGRKKESVEWIAKIWPWLGDILKPDKMEEMSLQVKKPKTETRKTPQAAHGKIVKRGKTKDGKRVVQYEDGTIDYE